MYCEAFAKCRQALFPNEENHNIVNGSVNTIKNYYDPPKNSLDAGMAGGKGLCNICSEKSKWKKNGVERLHTTKCCPYRFHFDIRSRKEFTDAMAEMIKFCYEDKLKESYEVNNNCNHTIKMLEDECLEERKQKITIEANNKFLKELFSKEEIQKRTENLNMYKEECSALHQQIAEQHQELDTKEREHKDKLKKEEEKLNAKAVILQIEEKRHKKLRKDRDRLVKEHIRDNDIMAKLRHQIAEDKNAMGQLEDENVKLLNIVKSNKHYVPKWYGESCSICLCDIGMDDGLTTSCGHHFHFKCYSDLQGNFCKTHSYGTMKCPNCRKGLYEINY